MTLTKQSIKYFHQILRDNVIHLVEGKGAHMSLEDAIKNLPSNLYGASIKQIPYTIWQMLEHIRLSQRDILDFIKDPLYTEKAWPDDYWPKEKSPPKIGSWRQSVKRLRQDKQEILDILSDPTIDILGPILTDHNGPSILHEILLILDHNAYHVGQIILIRRLLNAWSS